MPTHLSEDDLVLHYYGETNAGEEARATAHLSSCRECRDRFQRLQQVLTAIDERALAVPDLPSSFERTVWARLEPNLRHERSGWLARLGLSPARLALAAALLALVAGAFVAGRLLPRTEEHAPAEASATPAQVRDGVLLSDLGEHLDRSQMVLVELISAGGEGGADITDERLRAEHLLAANRLYRRTATATGDAGIVQLLEELERVLVELSASADQLTPAELADVQQRIDSNGLLFRVRVLSSEVRERQKSAIRQRADQRSSL